MREEAGAQADAGFPPVLSATGEQTVQVQDTAVRESLRPSLVSIGVKVVE